MNKKLLVMLLLVGSFTLVFYAWRTWREKNTGTLNEDSKNFAYADTAAITRIFIANKAGKKAELTRAEGGQWLVSGKYPARMELIVSVLKCLKYLEVKHPVSEKATPYVIKDLATQAIKVEFYSGDQPVRFFYVGGETQDHTGTYMLLVNHETGENYEKPYVMGLPGFEGYLTPRFVLNENDWRDSKCIDFTPPQLREVRLEVAGFPDSSFAIQIQNTTSFSLHNLNGSPVAFTPDKNSLKQYIAYLQHIHYERLLDIQGDQVVDSVRKTIPFVTLSIMDTQNKTHRYSFFHKKIGEGQKNKYGIDVPYDPDRLYLEFNDRTQFALIQYYVFGKLLQTRSYFLPKIPSKKAA
jgi:hypothetical protein